MFLEIVEMHLPLHTQCRHFFHNWKAIKIVNHQLFDYSQVPGDFFRTRKFWRELWIIMKKKNCGKKININIAPILRSGLLKSFAHMCEVYKISSKARQERSNMNLKVFTSSVEWFFFILTIWMLSTAGWICCSSNHHVMSAGGLDPKASHVNSCCDPARKDLSLLWIVTLWAWSGREKAYHEPNWTRSLGWHLGQKIWRNLTEYESDLKIYDRFLTKCSEILA